MEKNREDDMIHVNLHPRLARLERRASQGRWWRAAALGAIVALVLAPFGAGALGPVPHTFSTGGTISASEMNENFAYLQNAITDVEGAVPSGAIMHFNLPTCPAGWSEVTAARGRAIVGLNGSAGTLAGTVGSPLDDRENRTHNHSTDIGSVTSSSAGDHNHQWMVNGSGTYTSTGVTIPLGPALVPAGPGGFTLPNMPHGSSSADYFTTNAGAHTHSVNPPATTSTNASTGDVMPYVQYLVCQRD